MKRIAHLLRPGTALIAIVLGGLLIVVPTAAGSGSDGVVITPTIDGIAGANGWYRGSSHGNNVVLHWTVTDPNHVITGPQAARRRSRSPGRTTARRGRAPPRPTPGARR